MLARVVTKRDDARLAVTVAVMVAVGLVAILVDDAFWHHPLFGSPSTALFAFVAALILLGGVAPWLAWTRRGRAVQVRCEDGVVHAGVASISAGDVTGLSVAQGARGRTIAVARGKKTTFLEVERAEDAARIAETLGVKQPRPSSEALPAKGVSRLLAVPQALITLATLACAPLYFLAATTDSSFPFDGKLIFGLGGVIAAQLSMLLLVTRSLVPRQAVALGRRGAWDAHVALHTAAAGEADAEAPAEEAPVQIRIGNLERGDERVGAWLARLDAIPTEQHAYRGDAMKKDVLWAMLGDDGAPVDARMGAARVLRKRYGEEEVALVRVVEDPDVRLRIEAALEDQEEAERTLQTLGPLFRAR